MVVEKGTIFRPDVIEAIREITRELDGIGFESHSDERDAMRERLEEQGLDSAGDPRAPRPQPTRPIR